MSKHFLLCCIAFALLGCSLGGGGVENMDSLEKTREIKKLMREMKISQKAFDERQRKEVIVLMSLETMFPDPQVRALAKAAGKGRIRQIDQLVAQGVDVNARGTRNATPLVWAMRNVKGFRRLLELGADPNVIYDDGSAIMHLAVTHRDETFLRLALQHGGNPNLVAGIRGHTPLFSAMGPDSKSKIPILLDAGADMNFQRLNGDTPMMEAAMLNQFDTVFGLLQRGADYQLRNYYTKSNLAGKVAFSRRTINPESDLAQWMEKVIDWLASRGVQIPEWKDPAKK